MVATKYTNEDIVTFLSESNHIEDVYDDDSLVQAVYAWEYLKKHKTLNTSIILKTHKILMLHQSLLPNEKGYFRRVPVWVGTREGLEWVKIPEAIEHWITRVNELIKSGVSEGYEDIIKRDHIAFEKIHPFIDGNGRVGRLLFLWERQRIGLPIEIIYKKNRYEYYQWFREN